MRNCPQCKRLRPTEVTHKETLWGAIMTVKCIYCGTILHRRLPKELKKGGNTK